MLVLSFHGIGKSSCNVHKALRLEDIGFDIARIDLKIITLGMAWFQL